MRFAPSVLSGPISLYIRFDKRTQKTYQKAGFSTCTSPIFRSFRESFYPNGKKIVPANIQSLLHSRLALAVWYLDDGSLKTDCKAFRLHTNSFLFSEVQALQKTIELNFDIRSTLHKQNQSFLISIGSKGSQAEKFCNLLKPFVESEIPSMLYKFF